MKKCQKIFFKFLQIFESARAKRKIFELAITPHLWLLSKNFFIQNVSKIQFWVGIPSGP
jgi:hypothetical protein